MASPFKGLKEKCVELKIGGDVIKVKPTVADAELFMTMKREPSEQDAKKITKILVDMIARANPEEDRGDIESYVAMNYGDLIMKVAVIYGFTTQEQVSEIKKKLSAKI